MAANGQNGGVSRRRLPGMRPMELPAEEPKQRAARLKKGDLVRLKDGKGAVGAVLDWTSKTALVYWGTADNLRRESWVKRSELEKIKDRIVPPDEVIKRQAMGSA